MPDWVAVSVRLLTVTRARVVNVSLAISSASAQPFVSYTL